MIAFQAREHESDGRTTTMPEKQSCHDDSDFTDELGYACFDWTQTDCKTARDSLTAEGTVSLLKHCPVTCGVCEKTGAVGGAGEGRVPPRLDNLQVNNLQANGAIIAIGEAGQEAGQEAQGRGAYTSRLIKMQKHISNPDVAAF